MIDTKDIARLAHEVNRAYCAALGDDSQVPWDSAPTWQRASVLDGVNFHMTNEATPEESHANWLAVKQKEGWKYGAVKDPDKKEHPCCVPYDKLPAEQKAKDYMFRAVVGTCRAINADRLGDGRAGSRA